MLIEGCGLGGSLVEEGIVGDGRIDADQGLFAACGRSHGGKEEKGEKPRASRRAGGA